MGKWHFSQVFNWTVNSRVIKKIIIFIWYPNVFVNNPSPSNKHIIYSEVTKINSKQDEQTHDQRCDLSFYIFYIDVTKAVLGRCNWVT